MASRVLTEAIISIINADVMAVTEPGAAGLLRAVDRVQRFADDMEREAEIALAVDIAALRRVSVAVGLLTPAIQPPTGLARIALTALARDIGYAVDADRASLARGGQHHNGPRRITIEIEVSRARSAADWLNSALAASPLSSSGVTP